MLERMASHARLLLSTASLYPLDIAQCFELAAAEAFDGLELHCDARWSSRDPSYLRELHERYRIPVVVLHSPAQMLLPGWSQQQPTTWLEHSLALAQQLAVETLVISLPWRWQALHWQLGQHQGQSWWPKADKQTYRWLQEHLGSSNIPIALENMPAVYVWGWRVNANYWNTLSHWQQDKTSLALNISHWASFDIAPLEAYTSAKDRVRHIYLNNFDGRINRLPHRGLVNVAHFLDVLAEDGFRGTLSLAVQPEALKVSDSLRLQQLLFESLAFCRSHLQQDADPFV